MTSNTKNLTTAGIFAGLIFLLGMTPYGLIPLGFINLTIVHIPVITGAMIMNRRTSLILGAAFGLASTLAAFGLSFAAQSGLAAALLSYSPLAVIVMCMVPRMAVPMTTRLVYNAMCKLLGVNPARIKNKKSHSKAIAVSAVVGSLTNTVLYLGLMGMFFAMYGIWSRFAAIFSLTLFIGATCESIAAALIATAVVPAVLKSRKSDYDIPNTSVSVENGKDTRTGDFESSIEECSVAVIPATDSLLPAMDNTAQAKHDRCIKYLNSGNVIMADAAFNAFALSFKSDADKWGVYAYAVMRFIENSKYATAADRLASFMRTELMMSMVTYENKHTVLGIMNIIHASVANDAQTPVQAREADHLFTDATDLVMSEKFSDAADKFTEYMKAMEAKDRTIKLVEEPIREEPQIVEPTIVVREIDSSEDSIEEGISETNLAVIITAASVNLPQGADPSRAISLLSLGADSENAFEEFILSVNEEGRIYAEIFVILTYFEHRDYVRTLHAIIRLLKRGYSKECISTANIKPTILGILTIVHSSMRLADQENTHIADKTMNKAMAFCESDAYMLSAQLLEQYFLSTGLAK